MQPFPPAADLAKFEGDSIAQVRLDPHGVQFVFESRRLIAVEYQIEQIEPDGTRFPSRLHKPRRSTSKSFASCTEATNVRFEAFDASFLR
jgi:hypothetical protein